MRKKDQQPSPKTGMSWQLHRPGHFERFAGSALKVLRPLIWLGIVWGLYEALHHAPPDIRQGEAVRLMYVHVPAAWLSLAVYVSMAVASVIWLWQKHLLAGYYLHAAGTVGLTLAGICLATGMLWAKPIWGTWWDWDVRLVSMLVLFLTFAGIMLLLISYDNPDRGFTAASYLTIAGLVNLPVIKFSVEWWASLHQPASISTLERMADPALPWPMLRALLVMTGLFVLITMQIIFIRLLNNVDSRRLENMERNNHA